MAEISVVIPTYNRKSLLKNTLLSLNNQEGLSRGDYEVVLVDNGSTDNTREYIEGVNSNFNITYVYQERDKRSCNAKNRNTGWRNAAADIIVFLDSDMIVGRHYLKETLRCFAMDKKIALITTRLLLPQGTAVAEHEVTDGSVFDTYRFDRTKTGLFEMRHLLFDQMSYNLSADPWPWLFVFSCSVALSRDSLMEIGGFDEHFMGWGLEDVDLGCKIHQHKLKLVYNYKLEALHQYHREAGRQNCDQNLRYLLDKYPEIETSLPKNRFDLLCACPDINERQMVEKFLESGPPPKGSKDTEFDVRVFPIKGSITVSDAKEEVRKAMDDGSRILVLLDYAEDSDLHLWVQLETYGRQGRVMYFPMSRKIDVERTNDQV